MLGPAFRGLDRAWDKVDGIRSCMFRGLKSTSCTRAMKSSMKNLGLYKRSAVV